ncbi:MAG: hypothetical protein ACRCWQ_13865 [Bacilli bacterium]
MHETNTTAMEKNSLGQFETAQSNAAATNEEIIFPPDDIGALTLGLKGTLVIIVGYCIVIIGYILELISNEWEIINAWITKLIERKEANASE